MWQDIFLDEIRELDSSQAPQGIYGSRTALPNTLRTGVNTRLGWPSKNCFPGTINFIVPDGEPVHIRVESHASTTIRHYGASHVLDRIHGKKPDETPALLESAVPRLRKEAKAQTYAEISTLGLLFIAHVRTPRGFTKLIGKTGDADFLVKYRLSFHSRTWADTHGRDIHTGLFLWSTSP